MKLPDRILFAGAHCDDIELFAGGLLARACRENRRVGVLVFSAHLGVLEENKSAQAKAEFSANIAWLSGETGVRITNHTRNWLPACQGEFERERGRIYSAFEELRDGYDLVVTHSATDTNQDHRQVATEAMRALKAHATVLGGEFPNNDLGEFNPQVYFALSPKDIDAKAKMVTRYASQVFGGRPYLDEKVVRALATVRGSQIREAAAEAFSIVGRVAVRLGEVD